MIYIFPWGPQVVSIWEDTTKSGASKNFFRLAPLGNHF